MVARTSGGMSPGRCAVIKMLSPVPSPKCADVRAALRNHGAASGSDVNVSTSSTSTVQYRRYSKCRSVSA